MNEFECGRRYYYKLPALMDCWYRRSVIAGWWFCRLRGDIVDICAVGPGSTKNLVTGRKNKPVLTYLLRLLYIHTIVDAGSTRTGFLERILPEQSLRPD
jgi:hypothetical protein